MLERNTERFVGKKELCNWVEYDADGNVTSESKGILNIARATLDRWRRKPGFPRNHNPGGHCKWWLPDILEWMKSR
jgi:hypothetical protein